MAVIPHGRARGRTRATDGEEIPGGVETRAKRDLSGIAGGPTRGVPGEDEGLIIAVLPHGRARGRTRATDGEKIPEAAEGAETRAKRDFLWRPGNTSRTRRCCTKDVQQGGCTQEGNHHNRHCSANLTTDSPLTTAKRA